MKSILKKGGMVMGDTKMLYEEIDVGYKQHCMRQILVSDGN